MRRKATFLFVFAIAFIFLYAHFFTHGVEFEGVYKYYIKNFIVDTGAQNAVAAIYLNYRFFDTLFETLTLLVGVIGTIYFSRHGEENGDG